MLHCRNPLCVLLQVEAWPNQGQLADLIRNELSDLLHTERKVPLFPSHTLRQPESMREVLRKYCENALVFSLKACCWDYFGIADSERKV